MNTQFKNKDWSHVAGVTYPSNHCENVVNHYDPKAWMTTKEASTLFECSSSAVRIYLNKRRVNSFTAHPISGVKHKVWNRAQVMRIFERRSSEIKDTWPDGYISSEDAIKLLQCSRSSLYRYEEKGFIHPLKIRVVDKNGTAKRNHKVYNLGELERFKVEQAEIEAARQHMLNLIQKRKGGWQ